MIEDVERLQRRVSVLFNEPKLLKYNNEQFVVRTPARFSALQRAEIAEIERELR